MLFAPFRGSLFDPDRVPDIPAATCPPYDVIDETERARFLTGSAHNVVRLLLGEPGDATYQEAARLLQTWRREGHLVADPDPRFYLYEMRYRSGDEERTATGVIGALAVAPLGEEVLPHEETMPGTRADRLTVMRATRANLDLIVGLTPAEGFVELLQPQGPARLTFQADGVRHALYDVTDPVTVRAVSTAVGSAPVAIADGHHRYTTALAYRREQGGRGPWDSIMAFLAPAEGSGLTIGPTHRVFPKVTIDPARLADTFDLADGPPVPPSDPGVVVLVPGRSHPHGPLQLRARREKLATLPEPWREASPAVARELLYPLLGVGEEDARYSSDADAALADLHPEGAAALMAPVSEHAIRAATEAGLRFPQKSTFFMPKPRSGLVIRCFEDG